MCEFLNQGFNNFCSFPFRFKAISSFLLNTNIPAPALYSNECLLICFGDNLSAPVTIPWITEQNFPNCSVLSFNFNKYLSLTFADLKDNNFYWRDIVAEEGKLVLK